MTDMSSTELRRRLTNAVESTSTTGDANDTAKVVNAVMDVLVSQPLMMVLSGLSEEVILRRTRAS